MCSISTYTPSQSFYYHLLSSKSVVLYLPFLQIFHRLLFHHILIIRLLVRLMGIIRWIEASCWHIQRASTSIWPFIVSSFPLLFPQIPQIPLILLIPITKVIVIVQILLVLRLLGMGIVIWVVLWITKGWLRS